MGPLTWEGEKVRLPVFKKLQKYIRVHEKLIHYLLWGFDASTSNFDKSFRNYRFCYIFKFFTYKTNPFITLSIHVVLVSEQNKRGGWNTVHVYVFISKFSPHVPCFRQVILAIFIGSIVSQIKLTRWQLQLSLNFTKKSELYHFKLISIIITTEFANAGKFSWRTIFKTHTQVHPDFLPVWYQTVCQKCMDTIVVLGTKKLLHVFFDILATIYVAMSYLKLLIYAP